ncbi:MAG: DNA-directed RNA polymerase subunit omega [Flavobacteriales bacterium]
MSYKESKAPNDTVTANRLDVEEKTGNLYESIAIMAKRAQQINSEMKSELLQKLNEFAAHNENLDEIFENREQIEVSKFYEKLPKPTQIALQEWLDDEIYYRIPSEK